MDTRDARLLLRLLKHRLVYSSGRFSDSGALVLPGPANVHASNVDRLSEENLFLRRRDVEVADIVTVVNVAPKEDTIESERSHNAYDNGKQSWDLLALHL